MSDEWVSERERKQFRAVGIDPEKVAAARQQREAREEFKQFGQKRVLLPPWRILSYSEDGGGAYTNGVLRVITSVAIEDDGKHWLHVSYSTALRLPTYGEGVQVKELFIGYEKWAIAVLPPRSQHINHHPFTLHWWHCLEGYPLPDFSGGLGTI
jgi:hypothetical protein